VAFELGFAEWAAPLCNCGGGEQFEWEATVLVGEKELFCARRGCARLRRIVHGLEEHGTMATKKGPQIGGQRVGPHDSDESIGVVAPHRGGTGARRNEEADDSKGYSRLGIDGGTSESLVA